MGVELQYVGVVESPLGEGDEVPKQADEGAPPATLRIDPRFAASCEGLHAGDEILVVGALEALDGTPILDIKPVMASEPELR